MAYVNQKKKFTRLEITNGKFINDAFRLYTTRGAYDNVEMLVIIDRHVPMVPHTLAVTRGLMDAKAHPIKNIAIISFCGVNTTVRAVITMNMENQIPMKLGTIMSKLCNLLAYDVHSVFPITFRMRKGNEKDYMRFSFSCLD